MSSSPQGAYGLTIEERLAPSGARFRKLEETIGLRLRVALPGVIQSFDPAKQTVEVLPAVTEEVRIAGVPEIRSLPLLVDVPILVPRSGGYSLTLPIKKGDECLLVFADRSISGWQKQGTGSAADTQAQDTAVPNRHDLSDAIAIVGLWSLPHILSNYSTTAAQLRADDGSVLIELAAGKVTVSAPTVNVTGSSQVNISGNANTIIEGKNFLTHSHSGVQSGGATSGPVV